MVTKFDTTIRSKLEIDKRYIRSIFTLYTMYFDF